MSNEGIRKHYDRIAARYDEFVGSRQLRQLNAIEALLGDRVHAPVIEVGAGTGLLTRHLDIEVVAIDLSQAMLLQGSGPRILGDWNALPIPDNAFNTFFSISVLETDRDSIRKLKEMIRVLKPRGWFFLAVLKTQDLRKVQRELRAMRVLGLQRFDAVDAIVFVGRKGQRD